MKIYLIEIGAKNHKRLEKIKDKTLKDDIVNKIKELRYQPRKGKHLFKNYYELKAKNYRIYYAIFRGILVIEKIIYEGKILIRTIGTKDTQGRDIKSLKEK